MSHENDGHRSRLRERMMKEGLSTFQDHEILELLLFQFLPRKDTNKIAHTLLEKFGSIAGVLNATPQQLMTVKGISEVTACNVAMLKEVFVRYKKSDSQKLPLNGMASIIKYAQQIVVDDYVEKLVVVYVDNNTNFIYRDEFTSDNSQYVNVDPKAIVTSAVRIGAAGVILFHCHVKGVCQPSSDDIRLTERLYFALASINTVLLEHVIFNSSGEYYSFFTCGHMQELAVKYKKTLK